MGRRGFVGLRMPGWRRTVGCRCAGLGLGCQISRSGVSFGFAAAAVAASVGGFPAAAVCWKKEGWRCALVSGGPYHVLHAFLAFGGGMVVG